MKLQTNIPLEVLQQRFLECSQRPANFNTMREETGTWLWFRGAKAPVNGKSLPPAEPMFRIEPEAIELFSTSSISWDRIVDLLGLDASDACHVEEVAEFGSGALLGPYAHWESSMDASGVTMMDVALEEAKVYDFHAPVGRGSLGGTLPTMQFSIVQQALRSDLTTYLLFLAHRRDRQFRLYPIPEPARFMTADMTVKAAELHGYPLEVRDGDGKGLVNPVRAYLTTQPCVGRDWQFGRGVATDKGVWDWLARGEAMGVIQKKPLNVMSSEDLAVKAGVDVSRFKRYGRAPGTFVVNQFGNPEVCEEEKTVSVDLPVCLVAPGDGEQDLEIMRTGSVKAIVKSIRDMTSSNSLPSGASNPWIVSSRWEPSTKLLPVTSIGAALSGVLPWEDPSVLEELQLLFEGDLMQARSFLQESNKRLVCEVSCARGRFERAERKWFGKNSAYESLESGVTKEGHANEDMEEL